MDIVKISLSNKGENIMNLQFCYQKRDLIQKIFSITIILLLFFLTIGKISTVNAQDNTPSRELTRLSKKFGLVDINANEVPKGVVPLEFDSTQELEEFLTSLEKDKISTTHKEYHHGMNRSDVPLIPTSTSYVTVTKNCSNAVAIGTYFNTWADILVGTSGSFTWISSVLHTRVGLTGVTLGMDLSNEYSYTYNQSQSSVSVNGGAILNSYLVIEGVVKMYSRPVSCSFTYRTY